ncbi:MAG TPA: hypothetical protein VIL36_06460 [Acidimicrobiales bacterium]
MSSTLPPTRPPASGSPETNGSSAPPLYSTRFKIVAALLVTLAVVAFVAAYLTTSDGDDGGATDGEYVERLLPERDTQIVQQGTVGIDLAPGWEGRLTIDGVPIPEGQTDVTSLNVVQFTPGEGKAMQTLPIGKICAQARVWETATGPDESRTVSWCFDVI